MKELRSGIPGFEEADPARVAAIAFQDKAESACQKARGY